MAGEYGSTLANQVPDGVEMVGIALQFPILFGSCFRLFSNTKGVTVKG